MGMTDQLFGGLALLATTISFTYYSIWTLLTPFLPPDSPLQLLFPAREWAIRIPALLMLSGLCAIGAFVGLLLIKSRAKRGRGKRAGGRRPVARVGGRVKVE